MPLENTNGCGMSPAVSSDIRPMPASREKPAPIGPIAPGTSGSTPSLSKLNTAPHEHRGDPPFHEYCQNSYDRRVTQSTTHRAPSVPGDGAIFDVRGHGYVENAFGPQSGELITFTTYFVIPASAS